MYLVKEILWDKRFRLKGKELGKQIGWVGDRAGK